MGLSSYKITSSEIAQKGVVAAPDRLTGNAQQNKMVFDRLIRELVAELYNSLIDELTGANGAGDIGLTEIAGVTGSDIQTVLGSVKTILDTKSASADMAAALALKSDKTVTDLHIKAIGFNAQTGVFRFTREDGSYTTIDTALEKVATNWQYDAATQSLVLTLVDGTTQTVPLSAFITETEFTASDTITFSVSNHVVSATVKAGSITDAMLSSALVAQLQGYVSDAADSATAAASSELAAEGYKNTASQKAADAAGSASDAAGSASAAGTSETNAATSASAAATSASSAASSAGAAASSASAAAASESNAADSEASAAQSAGAAAGSESNAAQSAQGASGSATAAAGSATSAAGSATAAARSATSAATSESNAAGSASAAAQSATSASGSATAAATSATTANQKAMDAEDSAEDSEAWAVGQRGGQDVPSSDETYHNNARYWAGEAQHAAQGGVSSFNGRSGTVEPQSGDYTAAMMGARPSDWMPTAAQVGADTAGSAATVQENLSTHAGNTSNPHSVTKAQVGLGNVPNVATNDQTPTYTEAGTLAALTSGEKLSAAFGKLKKAVSDLISHLADATRHITAAERTSWNGKSDASTVTAHTGNSNIHVTAAQKTAWTNKQNALTFDTAPTSGSGNPVTSGGVFTAIANAANPPYVYSFSASDWTAGTDDATLTIAAAAHGFIGSGVLAQFWHQVSGAYLFNTWACIESWAEIDASTHVVTLHGPTAGYAGKVILYG